MNATQLAALLAFVAGTAAGMTTSALLRETAGTKSVFVTELRVLQSPLADGGSTVTALVEHADVTLALSDGGTSVVQVDRVGCALTAGNISQLQTILSGTRSCVTNAP